MFRRHADDSIVHTSNGPRSDPTMTTLSVGAYQVRGEYLMIESAAAADWVDGKAIVLESLMGIKRAGQDMILTYYAKRAAEWLK